MTKTKLLFPGYSYAVAFVILILEPSDVSYTITTNRQGVLVEVDEQKGLLLALEHGIEIAE